MWAIRLPRAGSVPVPSPRLLGNSMAIPGQIYFLLFLSLYFYYQIAQLIHHPEQFRLLTRWVLELILVST
jgi:hypothetical protein